MRTSWRGIREPGGGAYTNCSADDYPLFVYVDAPLYASRTTAGNWTCFNSDNAVFACVGLSGGARLAESPGIGRGKPWCGAQVDDGI